MKKLIALVASVLLVFGTTPALADQWAAPRGDSESVGLAIVESFASTGQQASYLKALIKNSKYGSMPEEILCDGMGQGECDFTKHIVNGNLILPACIEPQQENCVEALSVTEASKTYIAEFVRQADGPVVKADATRGLPAGSTVSVWQLPADYSGEMTKRMAVYPALSVSALVNGKYWFSDFLASVTPFEDEFSAEYQASESHQFVQENGRRAVGTKGGGPGCAFTEAGYCAASQDFSDAVRVSLTIRLTKVIGGWFRGRMKETSIQVAAFSKTADRITVSGSPVDVATLGFSVPQASASDDLIDGVKKLAPGWRGGVVNGRADHPQAWEYLSVSRDVLKDTSSGSVRVWSFGTTASSSNRCLSSGSKVLGIVTTNSTVYQPGAPKFESSALQYRVGAMHYLPGGVDEFQGTYDLVMRSEVARCLYGFTKAPLSGSVSVSGEGDKTIATTIVSEKDGWLKLAAYGFTFSNKTINVKLTQKKQTTITCVAPGKKAKKVTAANPKCPKGFKKR